MKTMLRELKRAAAGGLNNLTVGEMLEDDWQSCSPQEAKYFMGIVFSLNVNRFVNKDEKASL